MVNVSLLKSRDVFFNRSAFACPPTSGVTSGVVRAYSGTLEVVASLRSESRARRRVEASRGAKDGRRRRCSEVVGAGCGAGGDAWTLRLDVACAARARAGMSGAVGCRVILIILVSVVGGECHQVAYCCYMPVAMGARRGIIRCHRKNKNTSIND